MAHAQGQRVLARAAHGQLPPWVVEQSEPDFCVIRELYEEKCLALQRHLTHGLSYMPRSYWIPGSWHVTMVYTDDIPFHDPSQESNRAGQHQASRR
jgi:hypothetical protein